MLLLKIFRFLKRRASRIRQQLHWCTKLLLRKQQINKLRKKDKIKVLFLSFTPAMWKADSFYRTLLNHPKFEPEIFIIPHIHCSTIEDRKKQLKQLRDFFDKKGYHYIEWINDEGIPRCNEIPREYDILIYPQPWEGAVPDPVDFTHHRDRWFICIPYSCHVTNKEWEYNKWYQNIALIDCYENKITKYQSAKKKYNLGLNSVITGLPIVDEFYRSDYVSPWKKQQRSVKKIIWAPHWTITEKSSILPCYSNFLSIAEAMLSYAQANSDKMQIAFKPHPWLKKELYKHPQWGRERTDDYYTAWENGQNTQLEQGEYVDLFMTSDAMVHDSCSFCCEYMLTGKPVLFMLKNEKAQAAIFNKMKHEIFYTQYIGTTIEDISIFIEEKVINGYDPMKEKRAEVISKYLTPPHGRSAGENIVNAILGI